MAGLVLGIGIALGSATPFAPAITRTALAERHTLPLAQRETVPVYALLLLACAAPLVAALPPFIVLTPPQRRSVGIAKLLASFALALGISLVATNALKASVGKYRPDFALRCFPRHASPGTLPDGDVLHHGSLTPQCEHDADHSTVLSGRKSFPSGHASLSAAGLLWLALSLHVHLLPCSLPAATSSLLRVLLFLLCVLLAALIGITRWIDNRHFPEDIFVGFVIGCISAIAASNVFAYDNNHERKQADALEEATSIASTGDCTTVSRL